MEEIQVSRMKALVANRKVCLAVVFGFLCSSKSELSFVRVCKKVMHTCNIPQMRNNSFPRQIAGVCCSVKYTPRVTRNCSPPFQSVGTVSRLRRNTKTQPSLGAR